MSNQEQIFSTYAKSGPLIAKRLLASEQFNMSQPEETLFSALAYGGNEWGVVLGSLYTTRLMERALREHAEALARAAAASERHTASLNKATQVLTMAAVVLALAAVGLLVVAVLALL